MQSIALSLGQLLHSMLNASFEKRVCQFDPACTYSMGESERIFGEWLESRDTYHEDIDLITKGVIGMDRYGDPDRQILGGD